MILILFLIMGTDATPVCQVICSDPEPVKYAPFEEELMAGIEAFYNTDWQKADRIFNRLTLTKPEEPQPYFFLAMMPFWEYFFIEQTGETAEKFLERSETAIALSQKKYENSPRRYNEDALIYAEQLTSDLPGNVIVQYKKAEILENNGNKAHAVELFAEIAAVNNPVLPLLTEKSRRKLSELSNDVKLLE